MRNIREGDTVNIYQVKGDPELGATVIHTPSDIGDLWYFETKQGIAFAQNPLSSNLDMIIKVGDKDNETYPVQSQEAT